jgi:hypothetical protein
LIQVMAAMEIMVEQASGCACYEVAMRKFVLLFLAFGVLALESVKADEDPALEAFVQESRAMLKVFAKDLKGALQAAIEEGGAIHAISVCNAKAPEIARQLSKPPDWTVGRTSHKIRNSDNAPDGWEAMVLEEFLRRAAAGESLDIMEKAELVEINGRATYRYMKAIPVGEVCLTCHGSGIDPELKAQIGSLYPGDQATGFALGELRGAFTVAKTVEN